jgi:hypothetical protein
VLIAGACADGGDTDGVGASTGSANNPTSNGAGGNGNGGSFASNGGSADGGSGGGGVVDCKEDVSSASLEKLPADLIIAVDNSDSMALEAYQVKAHFTGLVTALTTTGIDAHVVLISRDSEDLVFDPFDTGVCLGAPLGSGNCPADENLPAYRHVVQDISSHNALEQIVATFDQWSDSLRPEATKTFLVVSDDESDMEASAFTTALAGLNPAITDFTFHAVVASRESLVDCFLNCFDDDCANCMNPCCDKGLACVPVSEARGQNYIDLQMATGGIHGDLCTQNFAPVFANMATAVMQHTQISCTFDVPEPSAGPIVPSETNVDFIPAPGSTPQAIYNVPSAQDCTINGGWYFDNPSDPSTITLCPTTCDAVKQSTEGEVRIKYGCETQTQPR